MSVLIIAEAGVNHNGSLARAIQMVDVAKTAGADIVKFQTFQPHLVVSQFAEKAEYQKKTTGGNETQLEMVKKLFLSFEDHQAIAAYCKQKNIAYLSTPFDLPSLQEVIQLGVDKIKIPSGEITHYQLLSAIAQAGLDVILSTGMCELSEIAAAIALLAPLKEKGKSISLLHCNTEYPTPFTDVNLRAMLELQQQFNCPIGYSDHTNGIEVPIAAVALGATIIEKHFTLDKQLPGPDHKASLDPTELSQMVQSIRHIEQALGDGHKTVSNSEAKNKHIARKYLVAAKAISAGDLLTDENVIAKRVGKEGISPMRWPQLMGQKSQSSYHPDEPLREQ